MFTPGQICRILRVSKLISAISTTGDGVSEAFVSMSALETNTQIPSSSALREPCDVSIEASTLFLSVTQEGRSSNMSHSNPVNSKEETLAIRNLRATLIGY